MSDWSKDINLETIKEYLQECAENDDYHYEQYQIDIVMHEYIRQKQIIEKLNNIINKGIEAINVYQNEKTLSVGYQDLKRIRGILRGNEFDLKMYEEY